MSFQTPVRAAGTLVHPALWLGLLCWTSALAEPTSKRALVLSGGIDRNQNHYSQYLQVRTLAAWLRERDNSSWVTVLFGAGNTLETKNAISDVSVGLSLDGVQETHFEPGRISDNRPATLDSVTTYFENLPERSESLYLLISDHGSATPTGQPEGTNNGIHLWTQDPKTGTELPETEQVLSRAKLASLIDRAAPRRLVYVMSQCYSGGFHELAVLREGPYPSARAGICGFTSSMPDTIASGCTSFVDGDQYRGYERFFTEELTGRDVVAGNQLARGSTGSVREAHYAARLRDFTLDLPVTSSEYYLSKWSKLIHSPGFAPRSSKPDSPHNDLDPRFRDFYAESERALRVLAQHEDLRDLAISTDVSAERLAEIRRRIQEEAKASEERSEKLDGEYWVLRYHDLMPLWAQARVESNEFETALLKVETDPSYAKLGARLGMIVGTVTRRLKKDYQAADPAKAHAFSVYIRGRMDKILDWALESGPTAAREASRKMRQLLAKVAEEDAITELAERREQLLARVELIRGQQEAALALSRMGDEKAIRDFTMLEECEKEAEL